MIGGAAQQGPAGPIKAGGLATGDNHVACCRQIKRAHVDYRLGILLGLGGIIGAQVGARLIGSVPTESFKKIFAGILVCLAVYIFVKK